MISQLYVVHCLTPLHAGTGQGIGAIDLPIARERATNIPCLPGSSLKGVLRDLSYRDATLKPLVKRVLGPESTDVIEQAGSLIMTDGCLLLLPVHSLAGTFAWVTSPYLLYRARQDAEMAGDASVPAPAPQPMLTETTVGCLGAEKAVA